MASAATISSTLAIQVASVPILIAAFGESRYATWLVLIAIPSYVSLSDLGLGSAAATDIARTASAGATEFSGILLQATVWSVRRLNAVVLITIVAIMFLIATLRGDHGAALLSDGLAFIALCAGALLNTQVTVYEGLYRGSDRYATGILGLAGIRFAEFVGFASVALASDGSLVSTALGGLTARILASVVYARIAYRLAPWARQAAHGSACADLSIVRPLFGPSVGSAALPIGNAICAQVPVLIASRLGGVRSVIVFSTVRTLCSVVRQVNNVFNHGLQGEMTLALARGELYAAVRLVRRALGVTLVANALLVCVLSWLGPWTVGVWTHGAVEPSGIFVALMAISTFMDTGWLALIMLPVCENRHRSLGLTFCASSALSIVAMVMMYPLISEMAVPIGLLVVDLVMTPAAYRYASTNYGFTLSGSRAIRTHSIAPAVDKGGGRPDA